MQHTHTHIHIHSINNIPFSKLYDNDITIWSPQGRLHQLEYAIEAVKQGSAAVGLRSSTHAILLGVKRSEHEMSSYQKKIFKVDSHAGFAMSGLSSDSRVLGNFMRTQAMRSRMAYNRPIPIGRLIGAVSDKAQITTQRYGKRPYGVGLIVAGYDETGPHLYEFSPSGNFYDYYAVSIGARCQSAKTYLEKYFESFHEATLPQLILHGLRALRDTLQQDKELTLENLTIAVVGKDHPFTIIENEDCKTYLDSLAADPGTTRGGRGTGGAATSTRDADVPMTTDEQSSSTPAASGDEPAPMETE